MTAANLIPALVLVSLALLARRTLGSWLSPGAFFSVFWSVAVWVPLAFAPDSLVAASGMWWIVASCVSVYVGSAAGVALVGSNPAGSPISRRWPGLRLAIVGLSIAGFGAALDVLASRGYSYTVFFSPTSLAHVEREFSVARYIQGYTEPALERYLLACIYLAALLGGLLLADRRAGRWRWLALLPLLPGGAVAAVETTRSSIYFPIVLMVCSFLVAQVLVHQSLAALISVKRGLVVGAATLFVVPLSIWLQVARYGYSLDNAYQLAEVSSRFRISSFGYLSVFTRWFDISGMAPRELSLGTLTFAGLFDALGIQPRLAGLYAQSVYLGDSGVSSNIYTIFRGLIQDFSPAGALLFLLVIGMVATVGFVRVQTSDPRFAPILVAFYAATLWSFIVDIFAYNTILLAWFAYALYMLIAHLYYAKAGSNDEEAVQNSSVRTKSDLVRGWTP